MLKELFLRKPGMKAYDLFDWWMNYPVFLLEKSRAENDVDYIVLKNALPVVEGFAVGGVVYWVTGNIDAVASCPLVAMFGRHLQTRSYVARQLRERKDGK